MKFRNTFFFIFSIASLLIFAGCKSRNLLGRNTNHADINELLAEVDSGKYEYIIKTDDKISVSIWNNEEISVGSIFGIYNSNEVYGKWVLVDALGDVALPKIGKVKLSGLSCKAASDTLVRIYSRFIVSPIVVVRVLNMEVTALGEVRNAGNYMIDKDHNTILEVIGKAGGFDFYADMKHVKLIRKVGLENKEYVLDFSKQEALLYNRIPLHSGDVIYVPTKAAKTLEKRTPIVLPFASAITTIIVLFKFFGTQ